MFDFQEELKKLPHQPGVYIMHDEKDAIIYVGKAIDLHNRVRSYFRRIVGRGPQIDRMVKQIDRFEYIVTDSELEALILENNLIKEHRPRYNTMLKDDKTYPYIKVTVQEAYPRLLFARQMKKDKARYFGPFTSAQAVKETIELLNRMYSLRDCSRVLPRDIGKDRPCLNYHMGRCSAPCTGRVDGEEYRERVGLALEFLGGNYKPVISDLQGKMEKASEEMRFEDAVRYRDLLRSVKAVSQKQKMSEGIGEDRDILGVALERENADADGVQFYAGTPFIPREIMLPVRPADAALLEQWLSDRKGSKVSLRVPQKGQKEKLVELAVQNAELILSKDRERLKREEGRTIGAVRELADLLGLDRADRMEAYDISNISGFANVGSMVVYEKGRPKRSDYRKFRIKSVAGPNDYACMKEVLTRRFRHGMEEQKILEEGDLDRTFGSFSRFPDLLMMDGGRGQVNIALAVLKELGLEIPVCGMVKDDSHRTRGLYFNNVEIPIEKDSEAFKLITRIQDEAHRFAIEYHRSLRSKAQVTSRLDQIPGVGPVRKKALMRRFASIGELREADVETLEQIPEINHRQALAIWEYFHTGDGQEDAKA